MGKDIDGKKVGVGKEICRGIVLVVSRTLRREC